MAEIDNGDILRIGATWEFEGVFEITNVYHAKVTAGGGVTYAVGALDIQEYLEDISTELIPLLSDEMHTDYLSLSNVTQDTTFGAIAWKNPLQGQAADTAVPPGVCLFAWGRTIKPRVQIRKYFGVHTEVSLIDQGWSSAARADANDAMAIHVLDWALGANLELKGVAYNRTLLTDTEAISVSTAQEPAYQRRRKRGRGS